MASLCRASRGNSFVDARTASGRGMTVAEQVLMDDKLTQSACSSWCECEHCLLLKTRANTSPAYFKSGLPRRCDAWRTPQLSSFSSKFLPQQGTPNLNGFRWVGIHMPFWALSEAYPILKPSVTGHLRPPEKAVHTWISKDLIVLAGAALEKSSVLLVDAASLRDSFQACRWRETAGFRVLASGSVGMV